MTRQTKLLDSSAWLSYYFGASISVKDLVESEQSLTTAILSLFEIERKLLKNRYGEADITAFLEFIHHRSIVEPLDPDLCHAAAALSVKHKLGAIDSLILATRRKANALLITGDTDFKGLPDVHLLSS